MAVGRRWLNHHLVGGGPTCLCLSPSPSAWLKQATDGVRRFPAPVAKMLLRSVQSSLPACRGNMGRGPGTPPSATTRVNRFQSGVAPRLLLQQPLCCPHMDACGNCSTKRASEQTPTQPLKVVQTALNSSDPVSSLFSETGSGRG